MTKFVSTPVARQRNSHFQSDEERFGYFETIGRRPTQEDALVRDSLSDERSTLSPQEIAHRLWTSYQVMNDETSGKTGKEDFCDGSTASTTVYDGKGNFITANLADAASFVIIYGENKKVLGVKRLNSVAHKPELPAERKRIKAAGDSVIHYGCPRVNGVLAVSRAIGDRQFKSVCADASLDINPIGEILTELNIALEEVSSVDLMACCDGFTDGAGDDTQSKKDHERFLLKSLDLIGYRCDFPESNEEERAKELVIAAMREGSTDNISVAIQNIPKEAFNEGAPIFLGVYDGHGGARTSSHVARHISDRFKSLCQLNAEDYDKHQWSVKKNSRIYSRDNALDGDDVIQQVEPGFLSSVFSFRFFKDASTYAHNIASKIKELDLGKSRQSSGFRQGQ